MLDIETFDGLVTSLSNLDYTYSGIAFNPAITQSYEDVKKDDPFIVVSHLPTSLRYGMSLNNFMSKRDNPFYNNYGYADVDRVAVRVFARSASGVDGRYLTQAWMQTIESYIKVHWNSLITNGSVDQYSFGHSVLPNMFTKRQFGYELMFDVLTLNHWTDEPDPDDPYYKPPAYISGAHVLSGYTNEIKVKII